MQEIFTPVQGYESFYEVSNFGNFRSLDRIVSDGRKMKGKPLIKTKDKQGRNYVTFSKNSVTKKIRVHVVVASHFIGNRPDGFDICHNDGNPSNNHVSNLRYDTHKNNMIDMASHGNSQRGEKNWNTTTTKEQILQIKNLRAQGMKYIDICSIVNVSMSVVAKVCQNRRWNWL